MSSAVLLFVILLMAATIIYCMFALIIYNRKNRKQRFDVYGKILTVSVIVLIPVMIWVDFIKFYGSFYIVLPIIYLLVNILMILTEAKEIIQYSELKEASREAMINFGLTDREREVAVLLMKGFTYQQIAEKLFIALQTVKTHAGRIYAKTEAQNKMELLNILSK